MGVYQNNNIYNGADDMECIKIWQLFMGIRLVILAVIVVGMKIHYKKTKKRAHPLIILWIVLVFLLVPSTTTLKDGGSTMYWTPLYEIISWNKLDDIDEQGNIIPGRKDVEFYLFPNNTKDFGE